MKLWLLRHAQPLIPAGVCYGRLDVSAEATATRDSAQAIAAVLPLYTRVFSSPLQRCEQLALDLIGLRPDLSYKTDTRLQEMNFGDWEGQAWDSIGQAALMAWTDDFAQHRVGQHGESVDALMQRVAAVFDEWQSSKEAPDTLWICHAGVIRAATLIAGGQRALKSADQWPLAAPSYGQWFTLT